MLHQRMVKGIKEEYNKLNTPEKILSTGFQIYQNTGKDVYLIGILGDNPRELISRLEREIILTQTYMSVEGKENASNVRDFRDDDTIKSQLDTYVAVAKDIVYDDINGILRNKESIQVMHLHLLLSGAVQDLLNNLKITYTAFVPRNDK